MKPKLPSPPRALVLASLFATFALASISCFSTTLATVADPISDLSLEIPASKFVLKNGLTVIIHEDHSAPLVAVQIWYHVGSKDEPKGRSGFAHLFEHLMFNGSEHFNDEFFKATRKLGATEQNGTTSEDRTSYFQTVPKDALDSILWLESDRMGHLVGAISQAKLDEQRAVVKNEKRQRDNAPYAKSDELINRAMTPIGHPYDHPIIGSMEDLDAASLEDVKEWFRAYYGPSNAVLVLAGDITTQEARSKVEEYFGELAPGAPVAHLQSWVAKRSGTVSEMAYDRVAQPQLIRTWNVSEYAAADTDYLQMLGQVLAGDRNSRLYKRLVIEEQLATNVRAEVNNREIGGRFTVAAMVKPGGDVKRVERVVDEVLKSLIVNGPTAAEVSRVRIGMLAGFARSLDSISEKAGVLAESQTYLGSPDAWLASHSRVRTATPSDLQRVARAWLSDGDYVLAMLPFGDFSAGAQLADRSSMPLPQSVAAAHFPTVERATLPNGLKLAVARRSGIPAVRMTMLFESGTQKDFAAIPAGTGALTMSLLDEGTNSQTGEEIVEALGLLGATLAAGGGGETSSVSMSALKPLLRDSIEIFADVVLHPAFADADIARLKAQFVANIKSSKSDPNSTARRVASMLLFGSGSAYGRLTTEASLTSIRREDIAGFHARWVHPNNATLVVVGDIGLAEIRPLVEAAFAEWRGGVVPETTAPISQGPSKAVIYLIDKPETPQTVIRALLVAPPRTEGSDMAREALNTVIGGSFTSRLNMKLREEKGWAYGASSGIAGGRGSQTFMASASVQADKSAESMAEIAALLSGLSAGHGVDAKELASAQEEMSLGLSGAWATAEGISQYLIDQDVSRLPDDYYAGYPGKVERITLDAVHAETSTLFGQRPLTWVVVGDRAKIESKIRALGLGELRVVDADGNPVGKQ